ncbi:MAG: hypothetical protein BMS9Abin28_1403 [Anaerolineae bacterium]|nr:MAG: hypothetical protein BMS9Abin28_1403 [Anaerolineae bacterium]
MSEGKKTHRLILMPSGKRDEIPSGITLLDGARIALLNRSQREAVQRYVAELEYVETATETKFQDHFVAAMSLPHASGPFPHLKAFLPADRSKPKRAAARRARDGAAS